MSRDELLSLAPYLISVILSGGIFLYAWQHRHIRNARPFAWLVGGQTLTTIGFIFELASTNLETKVFWDTLQWLTTAFLVILPFLFFAIQFSEHKLLSPGLTWGGILTFLGVFAALLLTDNLHHLFYANLRLTADSPFTRLKYDFTWLMAVYLLLYVYGMNLYGIALLIKRTFESSFVFRLQSLLIAFGFLIPLMFSFLALSDIQLVPQRDLAPIASTIGYLIAAWGLFRYGLFDILPIAREYLFENTADAVIVFDPRNRITDVNQVALSLLGKQRDEVLGRTSKIAFTQWPSLVEVLNNPFVQRKELSLIDNGKTLFWDISISEILGQRQEVIGRLFIARDVTKLRTLEADHQSLSTEFEQKVEERTQELKDTTERYRTIVEKNTDFIVRWKPDGTRTFVNEAYCRYWGITPEQAFAMNFLFHTMEEDRPEIEKKIARLASGETDVETEIHRVIRPDGSIGWQEWVDQAIRDEWGRLIEIQSVGRDITDRKQSEENLNY